MATRMNKHLTNKQRKKLKFWARVEDDAPFNPEVSEKDFLLLMERIEEEMRSDRKSMMLKFIMSSLSIASVKYMSATNFKVPLNVLAPNSNQKVSSNLPEHPNNQSRAKHASKYTNNK